MGCKLYAPPLIALQSKASPEDITARSSTACGNFTLYNTPFLMSTIHIVLSQVVLCPLSTTVVLYLSQSTLQRMSVCSQKAPVSCLFPLLKQLSNTISISQRERAGGKLRVLRTLETRNQHWTNKNKKMLNLLALKFVLGRILSYQYTDI